MRFDDEEYVRAYRERGCFPAIHSDIAWLIERVIRAGAVRCAFDIGCCTGLLTARLASLGVPQAIGIDANARSLALAPRADGLVYHRMKIDARNLAPFEQLLTTYRPQLIVLRRVLPEISGGRLAHARRFAEALHRAAPRVVVLEGRVKSARSTHPLAGLEEELAVFRGLYVESGRSRNCAALEWASDGSSDSIDARPAV